MTKSSEEVEREVEAARGRIDRTVEALKDKMQPKELFDEATRMMSGTSNKLLTTVVEQARANPLPIAVIGAGIAWWALSQRKRDDGYDPYSGQGYYETYEGYDDGEGMGARLKAKARSAAAAAKETVAGAREKVSGAVAHAKDGLSQAGADASERAADAKGRLAGLAGIAQSRAAEASRQAQQRFQNTLDSEPLILAGIALAVGAAIGASLPSTRVERRYVGPARDKALERGKALAESSLNDAKSVAQRAYDQAREELHRQTGVEGEGATLREKAKAVADVGVQTVRDEVDSRLQH